MNRTTVLWSLVLGAICLASYFSLSPILTDRSHASAAPGRITQGSLNVINNEGNLRATCPLKNTSVNASISGGLSRVTVTQHFINPFAEKIEAVYAFPLPHRAAVDEMTMLIGDRTVRGVIKRREEARAIYEAARDSGRIASLLDQERPNIFTQAVANITPGAEVKVVISYVETLSYEDGSYQFVFPMVVGPRYIPGEPVGKQGGGWAPDTNEVPDASKITPPVAVPGTRAGHDISIQMTIDAGVPLEAIVSPSHEIELSQSNTTNAQLSLKNKTTIPNKDFRLKIDVSGKKIGDAVLTHRTARGGFFSLILQPPDRVPATDITPKELVFVLDTSGSMSGFPIEKAKETMSLALQGLNPHDTFNLITFSGDTHVLFPSPVPATTENLRHAYSFLASRSGRGGTEMMKAIRTALDPSDNQGHIRVVCFMTDGYVGNDLAIIGEVHRHPNARVFSFGIGNSVNRFLLDKMAEVGRGEVEYVALNDDGSAAARRFHERVRSPLLTDIDLDWGGLPVTDIYPRRTPDLFTSKPIVITGRYTGTARGVLRLRGKLGASYIAREIPIDLPESQPSHDVIATLWARAKVADLMNSDYANLQGGEAPSTAREAITQIGLEYRLMTQFTSFVAVEEMLITDGGKPRRIEVPVEMPEGVSYDAVFGRPGGNAVLHMSPQVSQTSVAGGVGRGSAVIIPAPRPAATPVPTRGRTLGGSGGLAQTEDMTERTKAEKEAAKLHPSVSAVIKRLAQKTGPVSAAEAKFVRNGNAEVQIWLTDRTPAAMSALKQLGVEIVLEKPDSKLIIGRLPIEKLAALAELQFVRYIAPQ